jgi:DNA-binding MarR family transcriptional regulator
VSDDGSMGRLENLLGACSVAVSDRLAAVGREAGLPSTDQAALVTLLSHPDRTVSWLGDVLALTSSGATRLVDRLVAAGWVDRSPGADTRQRRLRLTEAGEDIAERVVRARDAAVADVLAPLNAGMREQLERALELVVAASTDDLGLAHRTCRLCDRAACRSAGHDCPLGHLRVEEEVS